jgi:hypothetical protein
MKLDVPRGEHRILRGARERLAGVDGIVAGIRLARDDAGTWSCRG